jgi:hypothetical protein
VVFQAEAGSAHVKLNGSVQPFWSEKGHSFYAESIVETVVLVVTMFGKEKGQMENWEIYCRATR